MSKKRFYLNKKGNIIDVISDSELRYIESMQLIVDLLNELWMENRQSKKENEQLKDALKELKEIGDYQADRIEELTKKIEKLTKENDSLKATIFHFDLGE